jgi:hypothetical protein
MSSSTRFHVQGSALAGHGEYVEGSTLMLRMVSFEGVEPTTLARVCRQGTSPQGGNMRTRLEAVDPMAESCQMTRHNDKDDGGLLSL